MKHVCCICKKEVEDKKFGNGFGNNPYGAYKKKNKQIIFTKFNPEDRCCDKCNESWVIPGRIYLNFLENYQNTELFM